MTAFQFHFASGDGFYSGIALSSVALAAAGFSGRRWVRFPASLLGLSGPAFAILSSNPTPPAITIVWSVAIAVTIAIAWFSRQSIRRMGRWMACSAVAVGLIAIVVELPHRFWHGAGPVSQRRLYVIGDSLSGFVGDGGGITWPRILATDHDIELVDLAVNGSTTRSQLQNTQNIHFLSGLVLIEIGGNDMFTKQPTLEFERNLDELLSRAAAGQARLVMLELPLLPAFQGYAAAQRMLAEKYHASLVPRRILASLLDKPGMTIADGIHLTQSGHRQMAEIIWKLIGPSFQH